jgi:archaellum component FlaC
MKSSAVMKEKTEGPVMSEPAESRIARIESHVEHLDVVTTDLRVELRRTNDKIDAGFQRLDKKIDDGHKELREKIDSGHRALSEKIDGGDKELGNAYKELNKKIDDVHHGLKD